MRFARFSVSHFKAISLKITTSVIAADIISLDKLSTGFQMAYYTYADSRCLLIGDKLSFAIGANVLLSFIYSHEPSS